MKKYVIICMVLFLLCCNKKKEKENEIYPVAIQDVKGMVYNNCTDSGLANTKVYLKVNKNGKQMEEYIASTDSTGSFIFREIQISYNNIYSYIVYIPSKSGDNGPFPAEAAFNGVSMYFSAEESKIFLKPSVTPGFLRLKIFYLTVPTSADDSIIVYLTQDKFHKNEPDLPYKLSSGGHGDIDNQFNVFGNYPMGLYRLSINKYKNGVHLFLTDSIYMGMGATKSHTINW